MKIPKTFPNNPRIYTTEQALYLAGNGHRYQTRIIILFFLEILLFSFLLFNNNFMFPEPEFLCVRTSPDSSNFTIDGKGFCSSSAVLQNSTDPLNNYTCEPHLIKMSKAVTISYGLFCEKAWYREFLGFYLRIMCWTAGFLVFGFLQNNHSRVQIIRKTLFVLAIIGACFYISFSLFFFILLFIGSNFIAVGIFSTFLLYCIEITSENLRPITISLFFSAIAIGQIIFAVLCNIYCNWRVFGLLYMSPLMLIFLIYLRVIIEGPRYLIVKKCFQEAKKSLEMLALMNDRNDILKENEYKFEEEVKCQEMQGNLMKLLHLENEDITTKPNQHSYYSLFKYNSLRIRSVIFLYFYGLFSMGAFFAYNNYTIISQDVYLNHMAHGFIKLIGYLLGGYLILNYQRKLILKNLLFVMGTCNILLFIYSFNQKFSLELIILNLIAQIAIDTAFPLLLVFVVEVYPTMVRHYAIALFLAFSILIIIPSKGILLFFGSVGALASVPLGILALIGIGVMNKLRETFGLGLKENIVEENDALLNNEIIT